MDEVRVQCHSGLFADLYMQHPGGCWKGGHSLLKHRDMMPKDAGLKDYVAAGNDGYLSWMDYAALVSELQYKWESDF